MYRSGELYYRYGKKASMVVRELGDPSPKQRGCRGRTYEDTGDLPRDLKPGERYSRAQKKAAAEHYLTHGGCLSFAPGSFAQAQKNASGSLLMLKQ